MAKCRSRGSEGVRGVMMEKPLGNLGLSAPRLPLLAPSAFGRTPASARTGDFFVPQDRDSLGCIDPRQGVQIPSMIVISSIKIPYEQDTFPTLGHRIGLWV